MLPLVNKEILAAFGIKALKRGKLYGCAKGESFTFIHTGMGAGFVGDAILYLEETPCKNLFLFGSCGSTGTFKLGDIVTPSVAYSDESFSNSLLEKNNNLSFYPSKELLEEFIGDGAVKTAVCQTVSSLKLEEIRLDILRRKGVDVVDMECSAFFCAANYIKRCAVSLFYVYDEINSLPFYEKRNSKEQKLLEASIKISAKILLNFL